jgi:hypothetical protein
MELCRSTNFQIPIGTLGGFDGGSVYAGDSRFCVFELL